MNVLVIGSGAREHAIVWKISQSRKVDKIFCAPGNGGIAVLAECVDINAENIDGLLGFVLNKKIDLTIVGPEAPLVEGIVDKFRARGLRIFGPDKKGARLEGSKIYAKEFMLKYDIPTARYEKYDNIISALCDLENFGYPLVIKADGLAGGKGVVICNTKHDAESTLENMLVNKAFGKAGESIVIEEFLNGTEASLLCMIDGERILPLESARDYKRAYDNNQGLNTGGMGAFSPNPIITREINKRIKLEILDKVITGLKKENMDYRGVLFIGLMITKEGPKVLEFNVRMGDPETQVVLPRLESDFINIIEKSIDGNLRDDDFSWSPASCVTVVAVSEGYPGYYSKYKKISGLNNVKDATIFHGGTYIKDSELYTNGGRVLAITALGDTLDDARKKTYNEIMKVYFEGIRYRSDIGK